MDDFKARLAEAAGYTGEKATQFASLLLGETEQELTEHAARLVDLATALGPQPDRAVDPSQGHGQAPPTDPAAWFVQRMDEMAARPRGQGPGKVAMSGC